MRLHMDGERPPFQSIFESVRRDVDPAKLKAAGRGILIIGGLLLLFLVVSASLVPSTEYLWFLHDARHPAVFATAYSARGTLFAISFVVGWLVLYGSLKLALNQTMVFLEAPSSRGQLIVTNAIGFVQSRGATLVRYGAPVLAFFSALDFSNEWSTWLLARHAQQFGVKDPTYGLDLSFFVFTLPWLRAVTNFGCALLVLTTLSSIGVYAGLQAMAALARIELGRPRIRIHIHVLIGLTILAYALQTFLKTYEAGLVESGQFTGAGYAAMHGLWIQRFVSVAAVLVGLATMANGWIGRPYAIAIRGVIGVVAVHVLGVIAYPAVLQRLWVDPDRVPKESPYAANAISMTRFAYDLNRIEIRNEAPMPTPTATDVAQSQSTLANMRLWDPNVLRECLEGYQAIRPYYRFFDVSIDRYQVGGSKRLLMLSPRLIDLDGLQSSARNWTNERLQYTHGYGVVVTRVDQQTTDGEPVMLDEDIPQRSEADLAVKEPRLYYGNPKDDDDRPIDEYAIVDTGQPELDYPTSDTTVTTRWTGSRGIPIGGFLSKLAFSAVLGDGNLLVSPEIRTSSRLLMHRNIWERASRIYPFLKFDADPYVVILNGRLVWMMDAYTVSDMMPYSAMTGDAERVNYIRNSVKVMVDAYSGETTAYAIEPDEPVLKAWEEVYPGLIRPLSEAPSGLADHFRYPEDMLQMQSNQPLYLSHHRPPGISEQQRALEHRGPERLGRRERADSTVLRGADFAWRARHQLCADPALYAQRPHQHERMAGRPVRSWTLRATDFIQPRPVQSGPRPGADGGDFQRHARYLQHQPAVSEPAVEDHRGEPAYGAHWLFVHVCRVTVSEEQYARSSGGPEAGQGDSCLIQQGGGKRHLSRGVGGSPWQHPPRLPRPRRPLQLRHRSALPLPLRWMQRR